ncbi:hypothetical protein [Geobacter sp.]|uniref:phage major tropism determinant n=1 Tax=Geobacter sp. TaxID=46610 RepID=UPI00261DC405|nr:hypothetical protein [Geobacter sp.]
MRTNTPRTNRTGLATILATLPAHYARDVAWALKGRTVAADRYTLLSPTALTINVGGQGYALSVQAVLDLSLAATWDATAPTDYTVAANRAGKDFYVYACQQGAGAPLLLCSANATMPTGYTANNSRKVAGFHCLCVAVGAISAHPLAGFVDGDILPESIWDISFRPVCSPEGMAYDAKSGVWVDIYLQSVAGSSTRSAYGATITDSRNWMDFIDDLGAVGKRLLSDTEFQLAAEGSNQATNIAGSADPVTTGGHIDTAARRMISNIGLEDCCGVMHQWLQDQSFRCDPDGTVQAAGKTFTVTYAAAPGGNPIYLKQSSDGQYYLACNMATALADKQIGPADYKVVIKHEANASAGAVGQLYYNSGGTAPAKILCNIANIVKDVFIPTQNPAFAMQIKHDAAAASNGRALYYNDGASNRLECNTASAANDSADLALNSQGFAWYSLPGGKGQMYRQGTNGDVKLLAGGSWINGASAGSRCRAASSARWRTSADIGARGCARSQ